MQRFAALNRRAMTQAMMTLIQYIGQIQWGTLPWAMAMPWHMADTASAIGILKSRTLVIAVDFFISGMGAFLSFGNMH